MEYCVIPRLRGKTKSLKAWKNGDGGIFAVSQCINVHFTKPQLVPESWLASHTNAVLAPWWMCKDHHYEQHSLEEWENIYGMDGGWEDDDPDEFSIRVNEIEHKRICEYYATLRARKAAKRAKYK